MITKRSGLLAIPILLLAAQVCFGQVRPVSPGGEDRPSEKATVVKESTPRARQQNAPPESAAPSYTGARSSTQTESAASERPKKVSKPASRPIILPPDTDTYVAVVDDRFLKKTDMDRRVNQMLVMTDRFGWEDKDARNAMRGKIETMVLQEWAELTLLAQHSLQSGNTASPAEVQGKMNEIYEEERKAPEVGRTLNAIGISRDELTEFVRDAILVEKLIDTTVRGQMQEKDLQNVYQMAPGMFATPPRVELNYMALRFSDTTSVEEKRRLKSQMESWRKKAAKKGKFLAVAKDFDDPELGQAGGYYGWATARSLPRATNAAGKGTAGRMVVQDNNELVQKVFGLKKGQVSEVLSCERGFFVFQLITAEQASGVKYSDAKPRVESTIYELAKDKLLAAVAPQHTIYMNTNGINFQAIAEAKLDKDELMKLREEQRKEKFMAHFRERLLQAESAPTKALVQRQASNSPTDIPQDSLDILRRYAASRPNELSAP